MKRKLSSYFRTTSINETADITSALWTTISERDYGDDKVAYQVAVMEQYKLYVEMADRVSARRAAANMFFLTLNTTVLTLIGTVWNSELYVSPLVTLFPAVALMAQCLTWFWIIRSYRQLNSAKWAVVGVIEKRLPAAPYGDAEWAAVGEGRDPARYWPLTIVESIVPFLFVTAYLGSFIISVLH